MCVLTRGMARDGKYLEYTCTLMYHQPLSLWHYHRKASLKVKCIHFSHVQFPTGESYCANGHAVLAFIFVIHNTQIAH
jgi:hypothetical protein